MGEVVQIVQTNWKCTVQSSKVMCGKVGCLFNQKELTNVFSFIVSP